ncbi:hypothetical protein Mapa_006932 [Marchantia paleacea]|nr:hypothetical protein Mapa_006932 [Marchantia paleacea]
MASGTSCIRRDLGATHALSNLSATFLAKRKRARTPTPGEYLGVRAMQSNRRGGRGGGFRRDARNSRHSPEYAPYSGGRDRSPRYSPYRGHQRDRSSSPQYAPYRR